MVGQQETTFKLHKVFLARCSSNMKLEKTNKLIFEKLEPDTFKIVLNYLYLDDLPENLLPEKLPALAHQADYFGLTTLKHFTYTELSKKISKDNAVQVLENSIKYSAIDLQQVATKFIHNNMPSPNELKKLSKEALISILVFKDIPIKTGDLDMNLVAYIESLYKKDSGDLFIVSNDGEKVKVYKVLLYCISKYFKEIFDKILKDLLSMETYNLTYDTKKSLTTILSFMFGKEADVNDIDTLFTIHFLSTRFSYDEGVDYALDKLELLVHESNVLRISDFNHKEGKRERLTETCVNIISKSPSVIRKLLDERIGSLNQISTEEREIKSESVKTEEKKEAPKRRSFGLFGK